MRAQIVNRYYYVVIDVSILFERMEKEALPKKKEKEKEKKKKKIENKTRKKYVSEFLW